MDNKKSAHAAVLWHTNNFINFLCFLKNLLTIHGFLETSIQFLFVYSTEILNYAKNTITILYM